MERFRDFTSSDFEGPLQGLDMTELVAIDSWRREYVNVHTKGGHPGET